MNRILLKTAETAEVELPVGSSKLLGNPDVCEGFDWPRADDDDGNEYLLDFLCQINCAQAAPYDKDGLLPKTGMLYFFYDLEEAPYRGDAEVVYYDGDMDRIYPMALLDDDEIGRMEQQITFENVAYSGYAPKGANSHFLLGVPCSPEALGLGSKGVPASDQLLLELDTFKAGKGEICFGDTGTLCFFIKKKALAKKDFTKTRFMVSTS